jgi:hypothetical protein
MKIEVIGGEISEEEKLAYVRFVGKKYDINHIDKLTIKVDGDYVDLETSFVDAPFERIRRITGYLVGTIDRFNDAKASEVKERVKHGIGK